VEGLKKIALLGFAAILSITLFGCGKKADPNKPITEVQAEADKMDAAKLRQTAMAYKDAITSKKKELDKLAEKISSMGLDKAFSDSAKSLQDDIAKINKSISGLTERFNIYYNKLKEKSGDTSGLNL